MSAMRVPRAAICPEPCPIKFDWTRLWKLLSDAVLVGEPASTSPEHALNSTGLHSRFPPVRAAREGETDGQRTRTLPAHGRARLPLPALRKRQAVPGLSHAAPELRSVRARLLVRRCRRRAGDLRHPVCRVRGGRPRTGGRISL